MVIKKTKTPRNKQRYKIEVTLEGVAHEDLPLLNDVFERLGVKPEFKAVAPLIIRQVKGKSQILLPVKTSGSVTMSKQFIKKNMRTKREIQPGEGVGSRLKDFRAERKIPQREIAEVLGCSIGNVGTIERKDKILLKGDIQKLSKHYNVTAAIFAPVINIDPYEREKLL